MNNPAPSVLQVDEFPFRLVLELRLREEVDASSIVLFEVVDRELKSSERGIYAVTENGVLVYIGKYEQTFSKRWLYTRLPHLYHNKRDLIAESLAEGKTVEVWALDEAAAKRAIGQGDNRWVNVSGIESALISSHRDQLIWNINGKRPASED